MTGLLPWWIFSKKISWIYLSLFIAILRLIGIEKGTFILFLYCLPLLWGSKEIYGRLHASKAYRTRTFRFPILHLSKTTITLNPLALIFWAFFRVSKILSNMSLNLFIETCLWSVSIFTQKIGNSSTTCKWTYRTFIFILLKGELPSSHFLSLNCNGNRKWEPELSSFLVLGGHLGQ